MISIMQPDGVTVSTSAKADQPSVISQVPVSLATVAPPAAVKAVAKKVTKTPAKKVAGPAKPGAKVVIKPVARKIAPKVTTKAAVKSVAVAKPTAAAKAKVMTPVKTALKPVIVPTTKPSDTKLLKPKKPKLVRDSFTIPKLEYIVLEELKKRSGKLGNSTKKSELIRAGIKALASMSDANFLKAINAVPAIKTGRPAKD